MANNTVTKIGFFVFSIRRIAVSLILLVSLVNASLAAATTCDDLRPVRGVQNRETPDQFEALEPSIGPSIYPESGILTKLQNPAELAAFGANKQERILALVAAAQSAPPAQDLFRSRSEYTRVFKLSNGNKILFKAILSLKGRALAFTNIVVRNLEGSIVDEPTSVGGRSILNSMRLIAGEAIAQGFKAVAFEGHRVTGMREKAGAQDIPYLEIFLSK